MNVPIPPAYLPDDQVGAWAYGYDAGRRDERDRVIRLARARQAPRRPAPEGTVWLQLRYLHDGSAHLVSGDAMRSLCGVARVAVLTDWKKSPAEVHGCRLCLSAHDRGAIQ